MVGWGWGVGQDELTWNQFSRNPTLGSEPLFGRFKQAAHRDEVHSHKGQQAPERTIKTVAHSNDVHSHKGQQAPERTIKTVAHCDEVHSHKGQQAPDRTVKTVATMMKYTATKDNRHLKEQLKL